MGEGSMELDELAETLWRIDGCPIGGPSEKHREIAEVAIRHLGDPRWCSYCDGTGIVPE